MKKRVLKVIGFIVFVGFCLANVKVVISQNGKISSDLKLNNIESVNASCESYPKGDNGDCKPSPEGGYCADSFIISDCKQ